MKLENKIIVLSIFLSLSILLSVSFIYSNLTYNETIHKEKDILLMRSKRFSNIILNNYTNHISNTLTLSTVDLIKNTLIASNSSYKSKTSKEIENKIKFLNTKWMNSKRNSIFVQSYLTNNLSNFLKKQQDILPNKYGELFITNKYGEMIASTSKLTTLSHSHKYWWKKAYNNKKGKIFLDDRGYDESVGNYVIGVVVPIFNNNEIIGILKANIKIIDNIGKAVKNYNKVFNSEVYISRTNGLIVFKNNIEPLSKEISKNIQNNIKKSATVFYEEKNNKEYLISHNIIDMSLLDFKYAVEFGGKAQSIDQKKGNEGEQWHIIIEKPLDIILKDYYKTKKLIYLTGFLLILVSLIIATFLSRRISKKQIDLEYKLKEYNKNLKNEVTDKTKKLNDLNKNLQKEIQLKCQENLTQYKILQQQNKLVAMGEMLDAIAHQWRQPLNVINGVLMNLSDAYSLNELDDKYMNNQVDIANENIKYLSQTINDFRSFTKPNKKVSEFCLNRSLKKIQNIVNAQLKNHNILLEISIEESIKLFGCANELEQCIINLLSNSKDSLNLKSFNEEEKPTIKINCKKVDEKASIRIIDNGIGISKNNIEKIFEPYFTTKENMNGSGIGLYLSKSIIEKTFKGSLELKESENSHTCFEILINWC